MRPLFFPFYLNYILEAINYSFSCIIREWLGVCTKDIDCDLASMRTRAQGITRHLRYYEVMVRELGGDFLVYAAALEAVFTRKTMRELSRDSSPSAFSPALFSDLRGEGCMTLGEGFDYIYHYLFRFHRGEYVYKSTLLNKIVFGLHSPRTSSAFEELHIGESIADFVVINGRATVYEIKTELDTLHRLDAQIADYYTAFDNVVIVCGNHNVEEIMRRYGESAVGVVVLNDRGQLSKRKAPDSVFEHLSHRSMFDILRKKERDEVLLNLGVELVPVTPVAHYARRFEDFERIPLEAAYAEFLRILKQRGGDIDASAVEMLPKELRMLGYFTGISEQDSKTVMHRLEMPLA